MVVGYHGGMDAITTHRRIGADLGTAALPAGYTRASARAMEDGIRDWLEAHPGATWDRVPVAMREYMEAVEAALRPDPELSGTFAEADPEHRVAAAMERDSG